MKTEVRTQRDRIRRSVEGARKYVVNETEEGLRRSYLGQEGKYDSPESLQRALELALERLRWQQKLAALDPETASPEAVDALWGQPGVTLLTCNGCEAAVPWVLRVGAVDDDAYEGRYCDLCPACLRQAADEAERAGVSAETATTVELDAV